jgi:diacylglycerol kinase family enzyme
MRYKVAFWRALPRFKPDAVTVRMERGTYSDRAITIVIANGQYFGAGVNIAPRSTLVDGLFDVQVFAVSRRQIPLLYRSALRGLHLRHPGVRRFRSGELRIETPAPWPIEVDGDPLGETPVSVSVREGALRFKI